MTLLEERIRRHIGHEDEPVALSQSREYILQALTEGSWERIERDIRAAFPAFAPEELPEQYDRPQRGIFEFMDKINDRRLYNESVAARRALEAGNRANEDAHNQRLQEQIDSAIGIDRDSLYQKARNLLETVADDTVDLRGHTYTPLDVDEAKFLLHYVDAKDQLGRSEHQAAFESLESMAKVSDRSLSAGLQGSADAISLEQARVLLDQGARVYPRAHKLASRISDETTYGEASYVKGEASLRMGELSRAGQEFAGAYRLNPEFDDIPGKIESIFSRQVSQRQVDDAILTIDGMISIPNSPFDEQRKQRMLVDEGMKYLNQGTREINDGHADPANRNFDLAYEIASRIDDRISQGRSSYIKGKVDMAQKNYARAALEFKSAFEVNRHLPNIENDVLEVFRGQIGSGQVDEAVNTLNILISVMDSPFDEGRKSNLLLEQVIARYDSQQFEDAFRIASTIDDRTSRGQSAYWKGEIMYARGDYESAARSFRLAHVINHGLEVYNEPTIASALQSGVDRVTSSLAIKVGESFYRLAQRTQDPVVDYNNIRAQTENIKGSYEDAERDLQYGFVDRSKVKFESILEAIDQIPANLPEPEPVDASRFTALREGIGQFALGVDSLVSNHDEDVRRLLFSQSEESLAAVRGLYSGLMGVHEGIDESLTRNAETELEGLEGYVREIGAGFNHITGPRSKVGDLVPEGYVLRDVEANYSVRDLNSEINRYSDELRVRQDNLESKKRELTQALGDDAAALRKEIKSLKGQVKYRNDRIATLTDIYTAIEPRLQEGDNVDETIRATAQGIRASIGFLSNAVDSIEGYLSATMPMAQLNTDEKALKAFTLYNLAKIERQENRSLEAAALLDQSRAVMDTRKALGNLSDLYQRQIR